MFKAINKMKVREDKGFTLVELLIVVAIIGILAAIAIPQFSAYRIRGYNASALADLRNAKTAEEAFFSDWQVYVSSAANGAAGLGGIVINNATATPQVTTAALISATAPPIGTTFNTGLSANVGLVINTSAVGSSYTMATKNTAGDRCYGTDSDFSPLYWVNGTILGMTIGAVPAAVPSSLASDFFPAIAGVANCDGISGGGVGGQVTWTAL